MKIALFNSLTTDEILTELEADAKKYDGLYVDMNEKDQRKCVKDSAQKINDLLKKLDRTRIDLSKDYKAQVEKEAAAIKARLENANKPYTLLIDAYKEERAAILAEEKARLEAIDLAARIEVDHEFGLLMNKNYAAEKAIAEQQRKDEVKRIEEAAAQRAIEQEKINQANIKQAEVNAENARLADTEYKAKVNRVILNTLINHGINIDDAKTMITLAAKNQLPKLTINY